MNAASTILHFIIYLSLMLAPKEADRITITGPAPDGVEISRAADGGWSAKQHPVSISDGTLKIENMAIPLDERLRGILSTAAANDWLKTPGLALDAATSLEKSPDGFILRLKEGGQAGEYRILYHRSTAGDITVNVLGAVNQPGAYKVPADGSLVDALAAAGGWTKVANTKKITLVRGPAGEIPKVSGHDVDAILKGTGAAPPLQERDTVYVPESVF